MKITKVIIPAAGLGTRFLPFTKSIPKEMLPLLNKPALHFIIEEALRASLSEICIITARGKEAMADYFDAAPELDQYLSDRNKSALLSSLQEIAHQTSFTYIRQAEARGLGHAISLARHCIGDEYVAIMLPDDIIIENNATGMSHGAQRTSLPGIAELIAIAQEQQASVIAVQEVPREQSGSYGMVSIQEQISSSLFRVSGVVEKPKPTDAPSNLAIIGRYILSPRIFTSLSRITPGALGEVQLTDAIEHMRTAGEPLYAYKISGNRHDVGNPLGWLKANISLAFEDPLMAAEIGEFLMNTYQLSDHLHHSHRPLP